MYKKIIIPLIIICLICTVALGGRYIYKGRVSSKEISELQMVMPDLSDLPDGQYKGSYKGYLMAAEVTVILENHAIKDIIIDQHKYERGGPAVKITDDVIFYQSLDVDVVTGATQSSKVILKAIENALKIENLVSTSN